MSAQVGPPEAPERLAACLGSALVPPDAAVPDGLVAATMAAVRSTRQVRPAPRLALLAAAAAVLVVTTVGVLAIAKPPAIRPTGTPAPGAAATSASTAVASPAATANFPPTVLGLDVISVSDALAVRATRGEGPGVPVPLAVAGWYTSQGVIRCPLPGSVDALEARCPGAFTWLTEAREDLVTATENSISGRPPTGPALNPRFLGGVASPEIPASPGAGGMSDPDPIPVVLVGHWNDGRAAFCTAAAAAACRREFVVDGVAWTFGEPVAPLLLTGTDQAPTRTAEQVVEAAQQALAGWTVASLAVYPRDDLAREDPRLLDRDVPVPGDIVWMARMIRRGEDPVTLLVSDLDGSTARLLAWPTWDPVVDGLAGDTAELGVLAQSPTCAERIAVGGILVWDGTQTGGDPSVRIRGTNDVVIGASPSRRLVVRRLDDEVALLQPGGHVVVTPGWHAYTVCELPAQAGAPWAVIVDVDGAPLLAYELACGSLDRAACLDRAAAVEEFVASQHPGRKLVSLTISDPCGTFMALLDDNTGLAVMVDCFLPTPSPNPSPGGAPGACGSVPSGVCEALVDLVRRADPVAFARADQVVVVGTCPPNARCALTFRPSAYVVLVPQAWDGAAATLDVWLALGDSRDIAFEAGPPSAARTGAPVPEFVVAAVAAAQP